MKEIKRIRAKLITKAESQGRSVIGATPEAKASHGPIISGGHGNVNYLCKQCGNIIAKEVEEGQIENVVLECTRCDSLNLIS